MDDKSYVVIVDSMADFEVGYKNPNLVIVETPVMIGEEDYTHATPDEFYTRQKEVFKENVKRRQRGAPPIRIQTAAPNPVRIEEEMRKILESGRDAIYVATASTLTSAFQSGRLAVDMINDDDEYENKAIVIDGLSMSALTAVMVRSALEACETTKEFLYYIFCRRNDTEHFFAVREWDAFRDSGRISKKTLMIANLIGFKPLMRFDFNDNGERKAFCEKKSRSFDALIRYASERLRDTICDDDRVCMIVHGQNAEDAMRLKDELSRIVPQLHIWFDPEICRMGPATGVHLGYSAIGLAFLRRPCTYENAERHRDTQIQSEAIYGIDLPIDFV
jgi:DegV family protein with EDD domain